MIAATIIAIMIIFGGGGGLFGDLTTEYVEDPIKDTIVEKDRRELALDELDSLEDSIEDFNENISTDIKQFDELVKDYDSTAEEFDQMVSGSFARRHQEIENIWERRSAMLAHIQADEWQTIISSAKAKAEEDKK
jgi:hypothetical protein